MSRTGENIYKRKDGRWEARYIDSYDGNGKAKYKYLYAPTYTEVKAKLLKAQNCTDSTSNLEKTKDKEKYEYWLDAWLHAKRLGVKESTYIRYRNTIENHIKPDLGKYPINKISTSLMEQFVSRKLQNGRIDGNGGLSPKSMSDIMVIVKESFKYAQSYGVIVVCIRRFQALGQAFLRHHLFRQAFLHFGRRLFDLRQMLAQLAARQEIVVQNLAVLFQVLRSHTGVPSHRRFRLFRQFQIGQSVIALHRVCQFVHFVDSFLCFDLCLYCNQTFCFPQLCDFAFQGTSLFLQSR